MYTSGGEQLLSLVPAGGFENDPTRVVSSDISLAWIKKPLNCIPLPESVTVRYQTLMHMDYTCVNRHCRLRDTINFMQCIWLLYLSSAR